MDSNITFIAITFRKDSVLFLKRNQEPKCWGPPSGHLKIGERIEDAIHREMEEETGLKCRILMPVSVWQGPHRGQEVFNVTYICESCDGEVQLSEEHSEWRWVPLVELDRFKDETVLELDWWPAWIRLAREFKADA